MFCKVHSLLLLLGRRISMIRVPCVLVVDWHDFQVSLRIIVVGVRCCLVASGLSVPASLRFYWFRTRGPVASNLGRAKLSTFDLSASIMRQLVV